MNKKGICVFTKNELDACSFKMLLEAKTSVRWADGSLPTEINCGYTIFCFEPNPNFSSNAMTGASYDYLKDTEFFEDLTTGKYDVYIL